MSLTCVIVEDQTMFLQMLHNMLEAMPQLKVAATARSKAEGIAACEEHEPDLLVLDLALPDGDGIAVARKLAELKPSSKTVILSGEANTFVCPADLQPHVHAMLDKMQAFDSLAEEISGPGWSGAQFAETPLTTTKKGGTGIGLYVARTAMENHRGKISFGKSALGGAEVKMIFPRAN